MNKEFTCICCPRGCHLVVDETLNVTGNNCPRGKEYALSEIVHPTRIVTSIIKINNRKGVYVSVKTSLPIPKEKIFDLLELIKNTSFDAPCNVGDVVISNPLGLQTDIVVTKKIA